MLKATAELWAEQNRHPGDRHRLFAAVAEVVDAESVLYPGSWCDVAASFVWPAVTYVDTDRRAAQFFDDTEGVEEIIEATDRASTEPVVRFIHADYREPLPLVDDTFDLLISLYAGPVSRHCTRYLRVGGWLLVNPSHGDVVFASIDSRYELFGAIESRRGHYRVVTADLDEYLVPRVPIDLTPDLIEGTGRGIAYTKPAFAYIFRRVR